MTIGDRVHKKRLEKGLTQSELAYLLGYKSKSSVAHIENGRDIPRSMVVSLAEILGTTPAYLMGWVDEKGNSLSNNKIDAVSLTDDEKQLVDDFRRLNYSGQLAALGAVKAFTILAEYKKGTPPELEA